MPRPILLFTGPWADLPLDSLAAKASEWGYDGLELCCWGDHLDVSKHEEDTYAPNRLDLLAKHDLQVPVVANHKVGQAICDEIHKHHQSLLPDHVWGDGKPNGVKQRATDEMIATLKLAEKLGAGVVSGFTGSSIWPFVTGYPAPRPEVVADSYKQFAKAWMPVLETARDVGVRFALEVHPGQVAFDLYSAEEALKAVDESEEFGFTFDPAHLHWQGVDPVEFLRRFPDRIFHVHMRDAALSLNGRTSVLSGLWPSGDPRRGYQFRSPGRGGIDWEAIIRALNDIRYDGPLSIDWHDAGMDREYGAAEACDFAKKLDFEPRTPRAFRG